MGFRFQKSIKLGGGFRLNLSKSGVGFSAGRRGARVGINSRGRGYVNVGIPGTGISNRIYLKSGRKRGVGRNSQALLEQQEPVLLATIPSQETWMSRQASPDFNAEHAPQRTNLNRLWTVAKWLLVVPTGFVTSLNLTAGHPGITFVFLLGWFTYFIWCYQNWNRNHPKRVTSEDARFSQMWNGSGKNLKILGAARRITCSEPAISVAEALNRAAAQVASRDHANLLSIQCCACNQFNSFPNLDGRNRVKTFNCRYCQKTIDAVK